jgi:hypothetical protein
VNQIKEQIEAIGDTIDEAEMVMITLNGLPGSWDSLIQGICSRRKLIKFSRLWEDCTQEEARLVEREEKLRKGKSKKEPLSPKKPQKSKKNRRDYSNVMCFCCEKLGHVAKFCPLILKMKEKEKGKRYHAYPVEDVEPPKKIAREDDSTDDDYVLISALIGTVTPGNDTWLVDIGASKHMARYKGSLSNIIHKYSPHNVKLGDDYQYLIKGVGEASYKLDSGKEMRMKNVLYVPGLKNLLSISALDEKGCRVAFVDGEVLMWPKGKAFDDVVVIGVQERLYKLKGRSDSTLIHDTVNSSELWHRIFSYLHYKALPIVSKMVTRLPEIQVNLDGMCKGCAQGKNVKKTFPSSDSRAKGILDIVHSDVCGPMLVPSLSGYIYYVSFIDDYYTKLGFTS